MTRDYRQIEFRHVCAIARAVFLRQPQMTDAEWKAAVLDGCAKQGWDNPSSDMLARALGAVERALAQTIGPRHIASEAVTQAAPSAGNCWTPADYRLLADTLKRIAARSAGANQLPANVSPLVAVERLDISEPAALDQFYEEAAGGDRLAALRRFAEVAIVRPDDWDYAAVRAEKRAFRQIKCFGCQRSKHEYHRHHVIQVQHGGSNYIRNIVALCHDCHAAVHPWLGVAPKREQCGDWTTLAGITPAALQMLAGMAKRERDAS